MNTAGVYRGGRRIHQPTEEELDARWEVMVKESWFAVQETVKVFLRQESGGAIINLRHATPRRTSAPIKRVQAICGPGACVQP